MSLNLRSAPFVLFVLFSIKLLALGGSFQDGLFLGILGLASCFLEYKKSDKAYQELLEKFSKYDLLVDDLRKENQETRDRINNMKLGQSLKSVIK